MLPSTTCTHQPILPAGPHAVPRRRPVSWKPSIAVFPRVQYSHNYPNVVLPTPDGPKISVTLPRVYPPEASWPGGAGTERALSSCVMPVDTVRAPRALKSCRAWDAETVGSLSIVCMSICVRKMCAGCASLRDRGDSCEASSPAIVVGNAIEQASARVCEVAVVP